jgi:hypothetical protein
MKALIMGMALIVMGVVRRYRPRLRDRETLTRGGR